MKVLSAAFISPVSATAKEGGKRLLRSGNHGGVSMHSGEHGIGVQAPTGTVIVVPWSNVAWYQPERPPSASSTSGATSSTRKSRPRPTVSTSDGPVEG